MALTQSVNLAGHGQRPLALARAPAQRPRPHLQRRAGGQTGQRDGARLRGELHRRPVRSIRAGLHLITHRVTIDTAGEAIDTMIEAIDTATDTIDTMTEAIVGATEAIDTITNTTDTAADTIVTAVPVSGFETEHGHKNETRRGKSEG